MTPPHLTERQQDVRDFITEFISEIGFAPSIAEIARALEIGTTTAKYNVDRLVSMGYLNREPGKARSLTLTGGAAK